MNKKILSVRLYLSAIIVSLIPIGTSAQVTIGSGDLPQATLDIVGNPSEKGKAFRMIDGNQGDGKVLTGVGNDGAATWSNVALHIIDGKFDPAERPISLSFEYYKAGTGHVFRDPNSYILLPPGRYMVLYSVPVWLDTTPLSYPNEFVRWRVGFRDATLTYGDTYTQTTDQWRSQKLQRELKMAFIDNPSNEDKRFYIVIYDIYTSNDSYTGNYLIYAPSSYVAEMFAIPVSNSNN